MSKGVHLSLLNITSSVEFNANTRPEPSYVLLTTAAIEPFLTGNNSSLKEAKLLVSNWNVEYENPSQDCKVLLVSKS